MKHSRPNPHSTREYSPKTGLLFIEQARKACDEAGGACEIKGILIGDATKYELKLKVAKDGRI